MAVNFHMTVALTYAFLPRLVEARGRVVNVTSVCGIVALPANAAYSAAKAAVEAYSDALRIEMLPWGVNVVVVQPALMRTPVGLRFFDRYLFNYRAAEVQRRSLYGDAWTFLHARNGAERLAAEAADPQQTVDALMLALVEPRPSARYRPGQLV
eukprot:CAMPEP_0206059494 /NCGR_PEP_ID=MMETSP1466-20131121/49143_1 /ASSEMBLY_ACC=CAM_ASM_001126 /TAXON_ID=44452 /ORGANISM="Pavlova gyrans, Strain CCMP608" /LENGTH=153 /DNA_ID=CAMNT_0053434817 /DNA_START=26 /DNA_END=484 /DNA_ORIENTATION=+